MAKKVSENKITSLSQDWGRDESNGLPYSGQAVQDFIKEGISTANTAFAERAGAQYFDPSNYTLYSFKNEEDKDAWLAGGDASLIITQTPFTFTGTVNQVKVVNGMESTNLYFTTTQGKAELTMSFLSQEKGITDISWTEVMEDFLVTVAVDKGAGGSFENIETDKLVLNGQNLVVDVYKYIATGSNRVRITAKGVTTGATANLIYSVTLTTMYISPSNFAWNKPFVEGQNYSLGGMNIGGNIQKVLKINVTGEGYEKLYEVNIGTNTYTTTAYFFGSLEFPTAGTGVYHFDIWLDANGLESEHLHYDIMCVASADTASAQLVVINDKADKVMNGSDSKMFSYTVYNGGASTANPAVTIAVGSEVLVEETLSGVATGSSVDYNANIEYESEATDLTVTVTITFGNTETIVLPLDNSASFPATAGASFYLNAATRNNAQANKLSVVNEVDGSEVNAEWTDVSFIDGMDGWTVDPDGRKCLYIPASSKVVVNYAPLGTFASGKTIEMAFRVMNVADYTEDIIRFATSTASDFMGVRIKPNNIVMHSNLLREKDVQQGYNLKDEEFVHVLITIVKNYKTNYGNLAQIYVNGVKACSFPFSGSDSWINSATLEMGASTTDLYIYKMRVFEIGFGWQDAVRNYISCLPDAESKFVANEKLMSVVDDSYKLDYEKIKGKKNTFVVEMLGNNPLPSYQVNNKDYAAPCNFWIDVVDGDASMNGEYLNEEIEGQGTTAMNYWRWNLRSKTEGMRITAKKNYASSMHSHKMGATSLFNDLHHAVVGDNEAGGRVAVWQVPVYGFQKVLVEGTTDQYIYEPIGLYTIGPDKGDKPTFGYDSSTYKSTLIHMEGSDHSPKAVGMDYPWEELTYSASVESLGAKNASGVALAAWEVGACAGLATDETTDEAAVLSYLAQEFRPAYDCDYKNTTMIVGVADTIDNINANKSTFRAQVADNGFTYGDCLIWLEGEYDTYYYNVVSQTYVKDGLNILADLGISESDLDGMTVEEKNNHFRALRRERYKATMENYWHLRDNLFHYCFLELVAATDNFKKNSYPYKFGTLESGSRWRWRQDDLDTLFDIDNQGLANKIYSILNGDTAEGSTTQLFRGNSSYHWVLIKECYETEIKAMMVEILEAMASLSPYGTSKIDKVIGCIRHYFWDKAQEYFPMSAYNADAEWTYEDAWPPYNDGTYQVSVHPLEQSLGSHYEAERAWVMYRVIFMASMYGFGPFAVDQSSDTSLGQISFRPSGDNTYQFTPAIDMNPTVLVGTYAAESAERRVKAGESVEVLVPASSDADTTTYLQGADYMQDIGDLSTMNVNENNPSLNISSKRLQRIKVGDETAENITTKLRTLGIGSCPSLVEIEARNLSTLSGEIDLSRCPRLKRALFGGTAVTAIQLPDGGKVEQLDLPSTLLNLSLVNMPKLTEEGLTYTDFTALTYLRVEGGNIEGFGLLKAAMNEAGSLQNIRVVGFDYDGDATDVDLLAELADGSYYGINEKGEIDTTILPVLEGTLNIAGSVYEDTKEVVSTNFPNVTLNVSGGYYVRFADAEVQRICVENFSSDGVGCTTADIEAITNIGTKFAQNSAIETFDEFEKFTGMTAILNGLGNDKGAAFYGCTNLRSIKFPYSLTSIGRYVFRDCNLQELPDLSNITNLEGGVFMNNPLTDEIVRLPSLTGSLKSQVFNGTGIKEVADLGSITAVSLNSNNETSSAFGYCVNLKKIVLPETVTTIGSCAFVARDSLTDINLPASITTIGSSAFNGCSNLHIILNLPHLSNLETTTFTNSGIKGIANLQSVESIGDRCFYGCTSLVGEVDLPNLTSLPSNDVFVKTAITSFKASKIETIAGAANFYGISTLVEVNLPALKSFEGKETFSGCTSLSTIEMPLIEEIGRSTFYGCTALNINMSLPNLKVIEYGGFNGTSSLKGRVNLPNLETVTGGTFRYSGIEYIDNLGKITDTGYQADWKGLCTYCASLREVVLPETLTIINRDAFNGCVSLYQINIPESVEEIGANAFLSCAFEGDLVLPYVKAIGDRAYYQCSHIENVQLDRVESLGAYVFQFCSSLKKAIIGPNCTTIGEKTFANCAAFETLIVYATTPPSLDSSNFIGSTVYIYVPDASVEAYRTATNWSTYASQIKPINVADTLPDISTVAENDLYKVSDAYWKAELVDEVLTWVEI